jgi:methylated-DNA-protein-cysteine methyltransferase related protein
MREVRGKTQGTPLRELIWQVVASIPRGKVASYGQIARLCGYPSHSRYVGTTMKDLPKGSKLPWFRVLKSNGALAFPVASAAYKRQKELLEREKVLFKGGKVPLKQYQWDA